MDPFGQVSILSLIRAWPGSLNGNSKEKTQTHETGMCHHNLIDSCGQMKLCFSRLTN